MRNTLATSAGPPSAQKAKGRSTVNNGSNEQQSCSSSLPLVQRLALALVYSGPLAWHAPAARLFGVRLVVAKHVDAAVLKQAEADSVLATRYFGFQVAWAVVGLALTVIWAPVLGSIDAWVAEHIFQALFGSALAIGLSRSLGADIAFIAVVATILFDVVASVAVVAVPLISLGRRAIIAASSGVSLALYFAATGTQLDLSAYPRLDYALCRLLRGVRRSG